MNAKMLSKVIEVENRVNTICKCLVLGEADHFKVDYNNRDVSIIAFTYKKERIDKFADLMRIYAEPEDEIKVDDFSDASIPFWTSAIRIPLK